MSNGDSEKRLNCLICGNEISVNSSYSIFYTVIPHSGALLANSIQKLISKHVEQSSLPSTFLCSKCFSQFEELDYAEDKCTTLRKNILSSFIKNCQKNGLNVENIKGIACQTEEQSADIIPNEDNCPLKVEGQETTESNDETDEQISPEVPVESTRPHRVTRRTSVAPVEVKTSSRTRASRSDAKSVTRNGVVTAEDNEDANKSNSTATDSETTKSTPENTPSRSKRKSKPAKKSSQSKSPSSGTTCTDSNTSKEYEIKTKDVRRRRRYVHPCTLCGRLFRRPCEVKQHLLSHGGAKPYQCRDCGKRFGSKSGAGIHALRLHGKDVAVENIIDVCHDVLTGVSASLTPENVKEIIERNLKENKSGDQLDSNSSTDDDDDFEWKLDEDDDGFGGGVGVGDGIEDGDGNGDGDGGGEEDNFSEVKFDPLAGEGSAEALSLVQKELSDSVEVKEEEDVKEENKFSDKEEEKAKAILEALKMIGKPGRKPTSDKSQKKTGLPRKERTKKKKDPVPKPPKHECPICGKMWRTMSEFKSHVATHSDERPFICEICGQAYKHKQALDIHVGMHNGINPFSCPFCNKAFTQKGALQRHMPIHTGDAPFQCELCGKRFVHHTSFNMHTLAHTGQKSYKCKVCGLALLSGSHLKRHSRVHTGERPYQCQTCGKRFAERYNLVAHTRVHDPPGSGTAREGGKKVHRCQLCGASFDRRPKLEDHLALSHNKISDADDSRKWVGHLISNELGLPVPGPPPPSGLPHQGGPGMAPELARREGELKVSLAALAGAQHQPLPEPQHQQAWHQMIFGNKSLESDMMEVGGLDMAKMGGPLSGQHRLLSEMGALGGIASGHGMGRNVLTSCLAGAGHPSLGHPHHIPNTHPALAPSRINMFSTDNN